MADYLPTASYSLTLRLNIHNRPGMLGRIASAIGAAGGDIGAVDIVGVAKEHIIRDLTVDARDDTHGETIVATVRAIDGVEVVSVSDRTFLLHLGGKIQIQNKVPLKTRDDLSMAYTPGVARVCRAIHADPSKVYQLTTKRNMVAIVTDGTAVLGLGDIGPEAALPVMEGKAMLFKEFANVDAFPICLATKDVAEIVATVRAIAPGFGGINLEDISAPRCFTIEERLRQELDIPVMHDDQHGTAVVVLAALLNALRIVDKTLPEVRIAVAGAGAAGVATIKLLLAEGARQIRVYDREGILAPEMAGLSAVKAWLAAQTNPEGQRGGIREAVEGADVFIGVSGPGVITAADVERMAPDAIVFALANPDPEIRPEDVGSRVRVMATGRSDYPNQINNVLAFPGLFRGALDCRAREINEAMKVAAARAIAGAVPASDLQEDYIIPSVFNRKVVDLVATAVIRAARQTGVARRQRRGESMT